MREAIVEFGTPRHELVARRLATPWQRLRGLLLTGRDACPVLLERCASVHTFGMGYPIDVAFMGPDGTCLMSERAVGPGRVLGARGARRALERPVSSGPWPAQGEHVAITCGHRRPRDGPA